MRNSKKLLSLLLAVLICITGLAVTSSADYQTIAYNFEVENYAPNMANQRAKSVTTDKGAVTIKNDVIQQQYQMFFKVTDQTMMKNAIEEALEGDGFLCVDIAVTSAITAYGGDCSPSTKIDLVSKANNPEGVIATTGENRVYSETVSQFMFDVSRFYEEEYVDQIKYVYVQIQCYDWGCGGGLGTKPNVTVYPIKVFNGETNEEDIPTIATKAPDPNQTTFVKFSPKARIDDNNKPDKIHYSSDGVVWKTDALAKEENYGYTRFTHTVKSREQVQTAFDVAKSGASAKDALNLAIQGSGYLKVDVTLQECMNMQGEPTIAEVGIGINTQEGNNGKNPGLVKTVAWQYPGTTRTYYLDVSKFDHISQVTNVVITVQNYWYYRSGTREMFDWNTESGYAGREKAESLGHVKSEIKPVLVISPITVHKGDREGIKNTDYDLVLKDFNQNGGVVPEVITLKDPNVGNIGDDEEATTVAGGVTTVQIPGDSNITVPTNMTIPPVDGACSHATVVKKSLSATYFAAGYSNASVCASCGKVVSAGKTIAKLKLKKPTLSVKGGKKQIKVTYKKVTGATGFQVRYRIKGKWSTINYPTKKNATKTIKKLKKGNYKVQIRAFVKSGGKTAYSGWSKAKTAKVK